MDPATRVINKAERVRFTRLAHAALARYDLRLDALRFINKSDGVIFHVAAGRAGGQYALRLHNGVGEYRDAEYHRKRAIESSLAWLDALDRETDIAVQTPMANRDGEWVTEIRDDAVDGPIRCTLLRWVAGDIIRGEHFPESARAVGGLMARMHQHAAGWALPPGYTRPLHDEDAFAEGLAKLEQRTSARILTPEYKAVLADVVARLQGQMQALGRASDAWGPMHGDLGWPENVVFHRGNIRPIDFNGCSLGHYHCDIARALAFIIKPCKPAFFAGYDAIRPLTEVDRAHIEGFAVGIGLLLLAGWSKNRPEQLRRLPDFIAGPCRAYLAGASIEGMAW